MYLIILFYDRFTSYETVFIVKYFLELKDNEAAWVTKPTHIGSRKKWHTEKWKERTLRI